MISLLSILFWIRVFLPTSPIHRLQFTIESERSSSCYFLWYRKKLDWKFPSFSLAMNRNDKRYTTHPKNCLFEASIKIGINLLLQKYPSTFSSLSLLSVMMNEYQPKLQSSGPQYDDDDEFEGTFVRSNVTHTQQWFGYVSLDRFGWRRGRGMETIWKVINREEYEKSTILGA